MGVEMIVDSHQHFWDLEKVEYPWLVPAYGPLYRTFTPSELEPQLAAAGIERTVLVQAANSYADTDSMLAPCCRARLDRRRRGLGAPGGCRGGGPGARLAVSRRTPGSRACAT